MSKRQGYVKTQIAALKESMGISLKVVLLECVKYLVFIILFLLVFVVFLILVREVSPVINILTGMKIGGVTELAAQNFTAQKSLFIGFIIKAIILALLTFILSMAILAFFDYTILRLLRSKKWDTKTFLKLLRSYAIIHALLFTSIILLTIFIKNPYLLAALAIVCMIIYVYLMVHAQAFFEEFFKGFKKIHYLLLPFILLFVLGFIILIIHSFLAPLLQDFILIPLFLSFVVLILWIKSYTIKLIYH